MSVQKIVATTFRFSPDTKEAIRLMAEREHRSMANGLEWLVREYFERNRIDWPTIERAEAKAKAKRVVKK